MAWIDFSFADFINTTVESRSNTPAANGNLSITDAILKSLKGTEDIFFNSADIKNINSTQQIKFKELTKRFYI